jgi:transposase-like protein
MDIPTTEQELRREAIRRRLAGEHRCTICADLERSPSWFSKWWAEYQTNAQLDFADRSRAPQTSPQQTSEEMVQTVVSIRRT